MLGRSIRERSIEDGLRLESDWEVAVLWTKSARDFAAYSFFMAPHLELRRYGFAATA